MCLRRRGVAKARRLRHTTAKAVAVYFRGHSPACDGEDAAATPASRQHPACILIFKNPFTTEFVEGPRLLQLFILLTTIVTEFQHDIFQRYAIDCHGLVAVAIRQRGSIPILQRTFVKPQYDFSVFQLFNSILPPITTEGEDVFSTAAQMNVILYLIL